MLFFGVRFVGVCLAAGYDLRARVLESGSEAKQNSTSYAFNKP